MKKYKESEGGIRPPYAESYTRQLFQMIRKESTKETFPTAQGGEEQTKSEKMTKMIGDNDKPLKPAPATKSAMRNERMARTPASDPAKETEEERVRTANISYDEMSRTHEGNERGSGEGEPTPSGGDKLSGWMLVMRQSKIRYQTKKMTQHESKTNEMSGEKLANEEDGKQPGGERNRNQFSELTEPNQESELTRASENEDMIVDALEHIKRNAESNETKLSKKRNTTVTEKPISRDIKDAKQNEDHHEQADAELNILMLSALCPAQK